MLAVGIAFILEYFDRSVKCEEDIDIYLGLIPKYEEGIKVKNEMKTF